VTLSVKQENIRRMAEVRAALERPQLVHVTARILVHGKAPADEPRRPCPCCGSPFARIVREVPDGEVLIDRATGARILPGQIRPETWARALEVAECHEVAFRVSEAQYPLLVDDTDRHALIAGSQRAGKTYLTCVWIAREWLHRGGKLRRFWLVAQRHEGAFELLRILFEGDGKAPPILPEALAVRRPKSAKAGDLNTVMVDGSLLQLRRFGSDPTASGLKSRPIVAGITDEAAEMQHENALRALLGRTIDYKGRLFLATTPVGGSFLREKVVEPCEVWERLPPDHPDRVNGTHDGARWISASISMLANPFVDPEGVARDIAAADKDSPSYKRDVLGLWCAGGGLMFPHFSDERHTFVHEARRVADMLPLVNRLAGAPQRNVTADLVRELFQKRSNPDYRGLRATNTTYLLGQDVNGGRRAMNTCIVQVTAPAGAAGLDPDKLHYWVVDVKQSFNSDSLKHADSMGPGPEGTKWARACWARDAPASPLVGCGIICDATAMRYDPTHTRFGGDPRGLVEVYGDRKFDLRAAQYVTTSSGPKAAQPKPDETYLLLSRVIAEGRLHVHARCAPNLIKSLLRQERSDKAGFTPTKDDAVNGPVDALRYLLFACTYGLSAAVKAPDPAGDMWGAD